MGHPDPATTMQSLAVMILQYQIGPGPVRHKHNLATGCGAEDLERDLHPGFKPMEPSGYGQTNREQTDS